MPKMRAAIPGQLLPSLDPSQFKKRKEKVAKDSKEDIP